MKRVFRFATCVLILMTAFNVPSYGWNKLGHMAVAFIAYRNLTPAVREKVNKLVKMNPEYDVWIKELPANTSDEDKDMMAFMIAATWPDRLRSRKLHPEITDDGSEPTNPNAGQNIGYADHLLHRYWHFKDVPFSLDGTTEDPPEINAVSRIAIFRKVLASNEPDELKSYDLMWLAHLVGDLHQPLHCTSRFSKRQKNGDRGGNSVKICISATSCNGNLHAFWDDALGTSDKTTTAVKVGQKLPKPRAQAAANLDVDSWVEASFNSAKSVAYRNPPIKTGAGKSTITQKYRDAVGSLSEKRMALAGARLANILNNELK